MLPLIDGDEMKKEEFQIFESTIKQMKLGLSKFSMSNWTNKV